MEQNQPDDRITATTATVSWAVSRLRKMHAELDPPIVNHLVIGSPHIHAKHVSVALAFRDDAALAVAKKQGIFKGLQRDLLALLAEEGYPTQYLAADFVDFVSETAVNEAGGPWIYFR